MYLQVIANYYYMYYTTLKHKFFSTYYVENTEKYV